MISALARLGGLQPGELPKSMAASGITDRPGWMALFSTHPPIEERIAALQALWVVTGCFFLGVGFVRKEFRRGGVARWVVT